MVWCGVVWWRVCLRGCWCVCVCGGAGAWRVEGGELVRVRVCACAGGRGCRCAGEKREGAREGGEKEGRPRSACCCVRVWAPLPPSPPPPPSPLRAPALSPPGIYIYACPPPRSLPPCAALPRPPAHTGTGAPARARAPACTHGTAAPTPPRSPAAAALVFRYHKEIGVSIAGRALVAQAPAHCSME